MTEKRATTGSASASRAKELIEALRDPELSSALIDAFRPIIARAVEAGIQERLAAVTTALDALTTSVTVISTEMNTLKIDNVTLKTQLADQERRLEDMEIYARAHDIIIRG